MFSLASRIRALLNIHTDESRMAALAVSVMLLTSAGFTLGSTGVEALFFARFGVEYLPYMYMMLGILSFLTSLGITALLGRVRREKLYIFIPIVIAILTVIAWMALFSNLIFVYPVLWLGKEVINSLISLVVWGIAGTVCDTRQSKRLFPLFNAGRILGAVLGGLSTGILVNLIGTQNLMLVWAGMLILAFALTRALMKDRIPAEPARQSRRKQLEASLIQEMQQGYQFVRSSALMRWISISAILFSVLYFSIALPFSKSAALQYPDENALAGFLGLFNGLSTAAAFLASIFIANRLYVRLGIMNAVLALPIIYLIGFGSLTITNTFAIIITFRFVQMFWLSGIADSAYQAMFNAVPAARRDQVRAFVGGVPEQAGTFLAGIILIIGEQNFSSQQLAIVGLASATAATFTIWRANRAYNLALVDALHKGRPTIFSQDNRVGIRLDGAAIKLALDGLHAADPIVRRVSAQMLSGVKLLATADAFIPTLEDEDVDVRLFALRGLGNQKTSSALHKISPLLADPQPAVRAQAVDTLRALTPNSEMLISLLTPMLEDNHPKVKVRTIVALLSINPDHPIRVQLRSMSMLGETDERAMALYALAEIGDPQALVIFATELNDDPAPISVRCAAASALSSCGIQAIPALTNNLSTENPLLLGSIASALGKIGEPALPSVLNCLDEPASENGALFALDQLPAWKEAERIKKYIERRIASSLSHEDIRLSVLNNNNERIQLLVDSLEFYARRDAINSLRAFSLLSDKNIVRVAMENLQSSNPSQKSNALETLETTRESRLIRPILRVFESDPSYQPQINQEEAIALLEKEKDGWLQACAKFAFDNLQKDDQMETTNTLSTMERIMHLHRVPLLSVLPPQDIQRVADLTTEQDFVDGDLICEQGDVGDEMYVIVSGEVRIVIQNKAGLKKEIARRNAGEVVGEMSIISGDARIASVMAVGDTRMLSLDRLSFEGLLRERPAVSLAVMKELCNRLKQLSK